MTSADIIARIKKQPVGFVCGLICLLCIGWLYYRSGALEARQKAYDEKSAEAAKVISNVSTSKNLAAEVAEIQVATKELEGRLVRESQLALNQQYFYRLEAETEVKVLDIRQNQRTGKGKSAYAGIPFNVNVQGPYKNVMAFLQRVEKGRHFCRVLSASFTKSTMAGEGAAGTPAITLALSIELLGQP